MLTDLSATVIVVARCQPLSAAIVAAQPQLLADVIIAALHQQLSDAIVAALPQLLAAVIIAALQQPLADAIVAAQFLARSGPLHARSALLTRLHA